MARTKTPDTRLVNLTEEYMDGIQMASYTEADEFAETVRAVPVELLDAYDAAWERLRAAEKALLEAWGNAKEVPNEKYVAPDATEAWE